MQMTTVGSALKYVLQLEQAANTAYAAAADQCGDEDLHKLLADLSTSGKKRIKALNRLYDDHVYSDMDTGVLAPIASMDGEDYPAPPAAPAPGRILEEGLSWEKTLENFYADFISRLESGPRTMVRGITKLAAQNGERIQKLASALQHP